MQMDYSSSLMEMSNEFLSTDRTIIFRLNDTQKCRLPQSKQMRSFELSAVVQSFKSINANGNDFINSQYHSMGFLLETPISLAHTVESIDRKLATNGNF